MKIPKPCTPRYINPPALSFAKGRVRGNSGFTLIEMAIAMVIIGLIIGLSMSMIGPLIKQAKNIESRDVVKSAKSALSGYAVKNGFLPATIGLSGARELDAWQRTLQYAVAAGLSGSGNACGLTATDRTIFECTNTACSTYNTKSNIAFVVYSQGEDADGAGTTTQPTAGPVCPSGTCYWIREQASSDASYLLQYDDIVQYATLDEIRAAMNCSAGSSTAIPSTPTGLASTVIGTSAIRLDWNAVATNTDSSAIINLTGYNIYKVAGAGTPTLYNFLKNSNTTGTVSYVDANAGYFNTYTYNITAVNAFGTESAATANVSDPGAYGASSIFQTTGATGWNGICIQFQVQNHTGSNISVTNNRLTWNNAGIVRYRISASTASQPACPATSACTAGGTDAALAYTLNANGGNTGYITVSFYSNNACTQQATNISIGDDPRIGFNANAYSIGDVNNGLQ